MGGHTVDAFDRFEAVGRPERVAAQAARVLAPGGALALSTWDVPERARLIGVLTEALAEAGVRT